MNVLSKFHVTRDENVDLSRFKESCNYVDNTPAGLLSHYRTCHNTVDEVNIQNDGESQKHSFISSSSKIVELEFGLV